MKINKNNWPSLNLLFSEFIEEEAAFESFRAQQIATIARRHKDNEHGSSRGFRNNLSRLVRKVMQNFCQSLNSFRAKK